MKESDKILNSISKSYMKKTNQFYWEKRFGILRIAIFRLKNKYCYRIELSKGWE
jgi:hypothetical protein